MAGEDNERRLAAIEKTYDGLRANADYQSLMSEVKLERREIVRFVG